MAEEAEIKKVSEEKPSKKVDPRSLAAFLEELKRDKKKESTPKVGSTEKPKIGIPDNFVPVLKEHSTVLQSIQKSTKDIVPSINKSAESTTKQAQKNGITLTGIEKILSKAPTALAANKTEDTQKKVPLPEKVNEDIDDPGTGEKALEEKKPQPVTITDLSEKGAEKFKKLFEKLGLKAPDTKTAAPAMASANAGPGLMGMLGGLGGFGKLFSTGLMGSMAGLGASLALAVGSWFNSGPFKGTMKEVGLIGTRYFLPAVIKSFGVLAKLAPNLAKGLMGAFSKIGGLFSSNVGKLGLQFTKMFPALAKFLGPILKKLPVIGTIINIGSAVSRFLKGDIIGGLIDIGSAVAVLVPGVGTALSIGLGFFNAYRDIKSGGLEQESKSPANVAIKDIFKKTWDWIADKFKKIFTFVFGKLGRGWDEIKQGDYVRGLVTWASFLGGPATWFLEPFYNWLVGPPEVIKADGTKEPAQTGILAKAWGWLKDKITEKFNKSLGALKDGWEDLKKGDIGRALVTWSSILPGLDWLSSVYNWAFGEKDALAGTKTGMETFAEDPLKALSELWDAVVSKVKDLIMSPINAVKKGWNKITSWFGGKTEEVPKTPEAAVKETGVEKVAPNVSEAPKAPETPKEATRETGVEKVAPNVSEAAALSTEVDDTSTEASSPEEKPNEKEEPVEQQVTLAQRKPLVRKPVAVSRPPMSRLSMPGIPMPGMPMMRPLMPRLPMPHSMPTSLVPLEAPMNPSITAMTDIRRGITGAMQPRGVERLPPIPSLPGHTVASNTQQTSSTFNTTMHGTGSDRDIPYIERNKYRQQLIYARNLL